MISIADFKGADGAVDWNKYHAAKKIEHDREVNEGRWCSRCGQYLLFAKGHRDQCVSCKSLDKPEECQHSRFIRCPACGRSFDPSEQDYYSVYREGEHQVMCGDCNHQLEISTRVTHTFTSPARIAAAPEPEE